MSNQRTNDPPEASDQFVSPIIVGIDFGASHTAAAYVVLNNANPQPIVLDKWPSSYRSELSKIEIKVKSKISTSLYYDQYERVCGWDENDDVWSRLGYPKPGVYRFDHFRYNFAPIPNAELQDPPTPLGKTVEDAVTAFLSKLRENIFAQLAAELNYTPDASHLKNFEFQYFMTVPASWNEEILSKFTVLTKEAGFLTEAQKSLTLVSGLEATMLQALSSDPSSFETGDYVLVADFGGHLVEMVTYQVQSRNPWRVKRCTDVSAEACGVWQTIHRFSKIIADRKQKMNLPFKRFRFPRLHSDIFTHQIVPNFGNPGLVEPHIWASRNHSNVGYFKFKTGVEADFPDADLIDNYMWYSYEEMLSCFEPVADAALKLLDEQVEYNKAHGQALKSCVLVGGSLITPYFLERIISGLSAYGVHAIQPDISLTCVKGAVLAGLQRHGRL